MGALPEDYPLFAAARYLGVAPWELAEQSLYWKNRALIFMEEEAEAQKIIDAHNARK